jgi:hypothetical protein
MHGANTITVKLPLSVNVPRYYQCAQGLRYDSYW